MPCRLKKPLISALFLSFFLSFFVVSPVQATEPIRLKFANFAASTTFPCVSMERWIEEVKKRTRSVEITTYSDGTLVNASSMLRAVRQGVVDIGCISLASHNGAFALLSAFELPLDFSSAEDASAVLFDLYTEFNPKEMEGLKVIALFTSAPSQVLSVRPVPSLESLSRLRLHTSGLVGQFATSLGALPVSMPQNTTAGAFARLLIDGVITSTDMLQSYTLPCHHMLKVNGPVYPFAFIMSKRTWASLPREAKRAINDLTRSHSVWTGRYVDESSQQALEWGKQTHGLTVVSLTPDEQLILSRKKAALIEAWLQNNASRPFKAQQVIDFINTAKAP